jgi:hypothetical protein
MLSSRLSLCAGIIQQLTFVRHAGHSKWQNIRVNI